MHRVITLPSWFLADVFGLDPGVYLVFGDGHLGEFFATLVHSDLLGHFDSPGLIEFIEYLFHGAGLSRRLRGLIDLFRGQARLFIDDQPDRVACLIADVDHAGLGRTDGSVWHAIAQQQAEIIPEQLLAHLL